MLDGVVVSEHMLREMAVAATHGCVGVGGGGAREGRNVLLHLLSNSYV